MIIWQTDLPIHLLKVVVPQLTVVFSTPQAIHSTSFISLYVPMGQKSHCFCALLYLKPLPHGTERQDELENVFVKHYTLNHMPDPKGEWSLKENNSELHYGICSKVYQFIYTLICNYMPIIRIIAIAVLQVPRSKGCSYTKCLRPKKESNATENLRNRFRS